MPSGHNDAKGGRLSCIAGAPEGEQYTSDNFISKGCRLRENSGSESGGR